ncbi:MAG: AAA family ATPase [Alphaproteobacteria bacterium]|nr:AAA family ATPase [Alphaproteobacteria bacterium]
MLQNEVIKEIPNAVAVASGKGGVGKTWFSISACHALAMQGKKVLLLDGDLGLANVDVQLGITPDKDLGYVIRESKSLKDIIYKYELPSDKKASFDIITGGSGSGNLNSLSSAALKRILSELSVLAKEYDSVIIDLGAGIEKIVRQLAGAAKKKYVIINDEPTSLTDAYAFIKVSLLTDKNLDIRIIVNMAENESAGEKTYDIIRKSVESFLKYKLKLEGIIRKDAHVKASIKKQTNIFVSYPSSEACADIEKITKKIH